MKTLFVGGPRSGDIEDVDAGARLMIPEAPIALYVWNEPDPIVTPMRVYEYERQRVNVFGKKFDVYMGTDLRFREYERDMELAIALLKPEVCNLWFSEGEHVSEIR